MSTFSAMEKEGRRSRSTPWAKKRRRLIVLFALLVLLLSPALVWRVRLASEVCEQLAALRAVGRPTNIDELHESMMTLAPEENAATFFREAAAAYRDVALKHWDYLPFRGKAALPVGEALPEENRVAMEALVAANATALERLHAGAKCSRSRYIDRYQSSYGFSERPHVRATELLTNLLCCDAALLGDSGKTGEAIASLTTALALVASLSTDGMYTSLSRQWQLETRILAALKRLMGQADYTEEQLRPFRTQLSPGERIAQWQRMCDVEQSLFLSRIGQGRSRGMVRNLLLAGGVGDLNLRAYLGLMAEVRACFGVSQSEQQILAARHAAWEARIDAHPMVYVTLTMNFGQPPAHWAYMRTRWDEALVAETAFVVAAHKAKTGEYPTVLGAPTPTLSDGSLLNYEQIDGGFRLWRQSEGQEPVDCWVVVPTPTAS
ncbi:MAG: hypothetical protein L3K26_07285 [Candidatus Hydrogenedentes bacterium]|nr:hypothetical protein [Candidatus Hydrogenedentota bacterium]